ncbi:MAG: GGDEF domain-containing protein [Acidobacteriaceae bacterium]|nr:GGDEF domain-containing protein [Acidobacteriaceae bacterium]
MSNEVSNPAAYTIEHVELAIRRLQKHPFTRFSFSSALEAQFLNSGAPKRALRRAQLGWMCIAVYALLLVGDAAFIPERLALALGIRLLLVLPLLIFANTLNTNESHTVRESNIVVAATLVALSNIALYSGLTRSLSSAAQVSVLTTQLLAIVVVRLRFKYASILTAIFILIQVIALAHDPTLNTHSRIYTATPILWGELFILIAGYSLERESRLTFLLGIRTDLQHRQLIALNSELARLSAHDALSGLGNRAAFERRYVELWKQSHATAKPLSVILFDIDNFKRVNDTQGHLYGDEVIRRVSQLILQSLRGKDDYAARYGGEEFVILLPDTAHALAIRVAQRIRRMIELAGAPAASDSNIALTLFTTVSGGVATTPGPHLDTPRDLLHAADTALYAAKAAGRNRVHSANMFVNEALPAKTFSA